jgi:hypothetical protein
MLYIVNVVDCVLTFVAFLLFFGCSVCRYCERAVELVSVSYTTLYAL